MYVPPPLSPWRRKVGEKTYMCVYMYMYIYVYM